MKRPYLAGLITISFLLNLQTIKADNTNPNDTIKTYNIDEVVVLSSTKETNTLRTLPGSVSIISPQAINGRQIDALKDISSFVPNLYIPDYGAKLTSAIYIRGIGARSSGQSVGLYVDNVPYLDKSTFDFELTDIQRIEVLRGPQGTLYGRNAMGGIVNIYTLSPFDYQGTKLAVSAGNHGQFKTKASHYMKIGDKVGISLSAYYDRNDGYFTNTYSGKKADHEESAGGRFKLDWQINPKLLAAFTLSYDYVDQGAFPYGLYHKETGVIDPVNINDSCYYTRNLLTSSLFLEYRTKQFALSSTTGFQYLDDDMLMDQDFSPKSIFTLNQLQKQKVISEEIAIKSLTKSNYQWSFGAYGFYNQFDTEGPVTFKEDGIKDVLQPVFNKIKSSSNMPFFLRIMDEQLYIPGSFETPSYGFALFHQSTYNNLFTEGLSLTAGIRLDYEKQEMDYKSTATMHMGMSRDSVGGTVVELPGGSTPSVMDEHTSQDFWQVLPKVSLKYECTPTTFTYLSVAKGYKTGGYNVQMSADLMQSQMQYDLMSQYMGEEYAASYKPQPIDEVTAYKPEKSWNYELGIRSELIDRRLSTELTLFYMDIKDMQITKFVDSGNGRYLSNAGKARSYGAELSLRARITNQLTADINYGFTHATFRDYIFEEKGDDGIIKTDCEGNYIPYIPRHTLNIGLQYNKLFRNAWIDQFTASAQFSGTGNIYWSELNDISQKFYGVLNAKAGIRKGIVKLDVWGRNISDTQYAAFYFESFGNPYIQKGKPFQIGAEISIAF
ncbi:iron complex outermembrane receptor protein [Parabacteroides sp. PF5-5]|uniref:TonB-dependent receptor n=1 Tax=unclassified Parabacteroides TaxID=2649774 RepID=UPI002476AA7F|nr:MULTISPECIES: TonB-dependent receptor [unclassified Parabacteroides]MDH6305364.1 iron complex outermembrane receptor protein [Parabacteroides sp. PH5-39]MDH6316717.1 iron complex outermembrane receptor protein [Parabacteroides sp. PF5-13]MDH6320103.1 iron complex outermembrane receptor protein [Parabacteroides sp. PH5-13]MDH6323954.1 iron complex outermembrane receptor protein [Parabacteroides sp. PH5-8]MDH6327780.1 iron complex outermembrane receptor protein [Parabacteroides sp. PH5-41]